MSINHKNPTKVVTGVVRLSYANVWEPASINGSNPKYSVSLIIPKTDTKTIDAINAAVDAAIKDGAAKFGGKIPNKAALKLPLRDGDLERDDEASSTPTAPPRPRSWTDPCSPSWTAPRSTPAATPVCPSTSTPSTPTGTAVSPAAWGTSRRCGTENLWAVVPLPLMTSPPISTMTSFPNNHPARVAEGNLCRPYAARKEVL